MRLTGKTALVTGGTSGIGVATARLFADQGARVAVTGRSPDGVARARAELGQAVIAFVSDAGSVEDMETLLSQVGNEFGQLDILFLNAGNAVAGPFEHMTEGTFDDTVAVNFKATFFMIQKALPILAPRASIIVTTSITNQVGSPNFSIYGACKAAQRSLVQSLGLALIGRGIRVNAISPGPIDTPMFGKVGLPAGAEAVVREEIAKKSPIRRFGDPQEVANVALFLASDESSYVVGQEIVVDGGMTLL